MKKKKDYSSETEKTSFKGHKTIKHYKEKIKQELADEEIKEIGERKI